MSRISLLLVICFAVVFVTDSARASVASTTYVESRTADQVKTTGDQQIAGTKTYTTSPIVPTPPLP